MPRIFDNIEQQLLPALCETLNVSERADFCVGYFNLRGWKGIDRLIERWSGGEGNCCRLLVGMQDSADDELHELLGIFRHGEEMDNNTAIRLKRKLAERFRKQLTVGTPTNEDEAGLRRLAAQLRTRKVVVKLFLRHRLHAKLYLLFRPDPNNPSTGFVGSSNLTMSGLAQQGELNVDVLEHDSCRKLANWFDSRWNDPWCVDISRELIDIIEESWAREPLVPPYHIYVKMAYHLSQEARASLSEFGIPKDFGNKLFEFQVKAVQIAAHHLNKRGGVLIGDVVGLGKTLMATAVARIFEDYPHNLETLIICPPNLQPMWEDYRVRYHLRGKVLPLSLVQRDLPSLPPHRIVVVDESHNLRNPESKRFRAIQEYIEKCNSKVMLLTATPYNKTYLDLSGQLQLFLPKDKDIGIRPERMLRDVGEAKFVQDHQCAVRTLAAFEYSREADDWRDLMRLYLVRRTRSFIKASYAATDPKDGRKYLTFEDGTHSYFPERVPCTLGFRIDNSNPNDQYARLYSEEVVATIGALCLPRYGLGLYKTVDPKPPPAPAEIEALDDLAKAGKRLMGFCRTNLFKRLESSGQSFLQSVERHILRNYIYLHAIEHNLPLPIGTQDSDLLDTRFSDADLGLAGGTLEGSGDNSENDADTRGLRTVEEFRQRAAQAYKGYSTSGPRRFKWLRPALFKPELAQDLRADAEALLAVLVRSGAWNPEYDTKLEALRTLLTRTHAKNDEKVIVFSQFADTVEYLTNQLKRRGLTKLAGVTGDSPDPTAVAWRFSPESNEKRNKIPPSDELRVLIATDVLSEGQNLQDCYIVVNYDLPWAIIRLIQRVGRVDRIGQKAEKILCYSFLPADGVERILRLRGRVRQRLHENAEVVGTDEAFFEDDDDQTVRDLYTEKSGILDKEDDSEVDLGSKAYQIWLDAIKADPGLEKQIEALPPVVFSAKAHENTEREPHGVLVYMRTAQGNDALAWISEKGESVTESQLTVLKAAACTPDTPPLVRSDNHHELVRRGAELVADEEKLVGGQLGRRTGARFRTYERLKYFVQQSKGTLFETRELARALDDIYRYPLRSSATERLNRQLRSPSDEALARQVLELYEQDLLCQAHEAEESQEPRIICSLGLRKP